MAVVEYSREGWFQRIGNAIKGVIVGALMFLIAFPVLFWNEGRAVHTARMLEEGAAAVVPVDSVSVNPANDGKLVHFTANTVNASDKALGDPQLHVEAPKDAIRLKRTVEMYQWKENKKEEKKKDAVGGGETTKTTYDYEKVWKDEPIDSGSFKQRGHDNPRDMRFRSQEPWDASKVTAGAFTLSPELVDKIDEFTGLPVSDKALDALPDDVKENAAASDGLLYIGRDGKPSASSPDVGDLRVTYKIVSAGPVSVIAMQKPGAAATAGAAGGPNLAAYTTKNGPLQLVYPGTHSAQEMFTAEQQKNTTLTWILRAVGFLLMWIGLAVALSPLKVLADVIGILGDIAGVGIGLVTFVIALCLSTVTIGVAWIAYRPLVGGALLAVAAAAAVLFIWLRRRGAARRAALSPAPGGFPVGVGTNA